MEKICPSCGHRFDTELAPDMKDACPKCMADFLMDETVSMDSDEARGGDIPAPLDVGATFHGMDIVEFLGRGGMGFVYKARQPNLDRMVALKIMDPSLSHSPEFTARFNREAKALAALNHPAIIQVHDYGHEDELYFLVMEFIDGTTLRHILNARRIDSADALRYVPQICDALEYAHSKGVIHRDIKPENILLDKSGKLKIADFGLAKMQAEGTLDEAQLTLSGRVMGTRSYMAPEQHKSPGSVDHRADIYSLGVVFYEMLTGELPIGRFPSPSQVAKVDVHLDEVVLKALENSPERRYQHASEVKDDMRRDDRTSPRASSGTAAAPTRRLSRLALWGALGLPMAIGSGLLIFLIGYMFEADHDRCAMAGAIMALITQVAGIGLSIAGLVAVRENPDRLRGTGVAKFGIYFPVGLAVIWFVGTIILFTLPGGGPGGLSIKAFLLTFGYWTLALGYMAFCFIRFLGVHPLPVIAVCIALMIGLGSMTTIQLRRAQAGFAQHEAEMAEIRREFDHTDRILSATPDSVSSDELERPLFALIELTGEPAPLPDIVERLSDVIDPELVSAMVQSESQSAPRPMARNGEFLEPSDVIHYIKRSKVIGMSSSLPGIGGDRMAANATVIGDGRFEFEVPVRYLTDQGWRLGQCKLVDAIMVELLKQHL
ncbi:MAG: serine/threonine-protein kinase [Verrucomicrobiota bacterium]